MIGGGSRGASGMGRAVEMVSMGKSSSAMNGAAGSGRDESQGVEAGEEGGEGGGLDEGVKKGVLGGGVHGGGPQSDPATKA
jgi:hypothetical protein